MDPAATRAVYSPRECPARKSAAIPRRRSACQAAIETVITAGWVFAVRASSCSGPAKMSRESGSPRAASAAWKTSRLSGKVRFSSKPIPTVWEPCPGNITARPPKDLSGNWRIGAGLPADNRRSPGQPGPESGKEEDRLLLDEPGPYGLVQGDGNRSGRRVADPIDVDEDPRRVEPQPLRDTVDDPEIGLVGNKQVDVLRSQPGGLDDLPRDFLDGAEGDLERLVPAHLDRMQPFTDRGLRRRIGRPSAGDHDVVSHRAIGVDARRQHAAGRIARRHQDSPGAVREDDACGAVLPVDVLGQQLRPDDEDRPIAAGDDELLGDRQGVDEPRAARLHVEGGALRRSQIVLDEAGGRGNG